MGKKNTTNSLVIIIILVLVVGLVVFIFINKLVNKNSPTVIPVTVQNQITTPETSISYNNTEYGFNFSLPISWKDYSIVVDKWIGQIVNTKEEAELSAQIEGPKILIRNPLWTKEVPRQDIPIMIFTLSQWNKIQQEKLSVGAAPIGPSELGRNKNYVFALPARYNFAYPIGFEDVQKIIESKAL